MVKFRRSGISGNRGVYLIYEVKCSIRILPFILELRIMSEQAEI
jgi:hypothetical protein